MEEDFDPEQFDKNMNEVFGDDYYNAEETEKPVFEDDPYINSIIDHYDDDDDDEHLTKKSKRAKAREKARQAKAEAQEAEKDGFNYCVLFFFRN